MIKTKAIWGETGLFQLTASRPSWRDIQGGIQGGRSLEAGAIEGYCLVSCSSRLAQPAFLHNPEPPAKGSTTHTGLSLPTLFNQDKVSQTYLQTTWRFLF